MTSLSVPSQDKGGGLGVVLATPTLETKSQQEITENFVQRAEGSFTQRIMKQSDESRKEAAKLNIFLATRKPIHRPIGTWNVRTMYESGKSTQVAA